MEFYQTANSFVNLRMVSFAPSKIFFNVTDDDKNHDRYQSYTKASAFYERPEGGGIK